MSSQKALLLPDAVGSSPSERAEQLLLSRPHGVLCTASAKNDGWPFGSVAPYGLDRHGRPLIYIAGIAEHTRNIKQDPRISLLIHDEPHGTEDVQTHGRLTLMGEALAVPKEEQEDSWERYLARLPAAQDYKKTHDFTLYAIDIVKVRFIGGFGDIHWLPKGNFQRDVEDASWDAQKRYTVEHMNEDHVAAMQVLCQVHGGFTAGEDVVMTGVDRYGIDLHTPSAEKKLRIDFGQRVDPKDIRPAVVGLVKAARQKLGPELVKP